MGARDWKSVVNDNFPPAPVEVQTHNILPVGGWYWLSELFVKRVQFIREHLSRLTCDILGSGATHLVMATFRSSNASA